MLLSKIFKGTDVKVNEDIDIKYITSDYQVILTTTDLAKISKKLISEANIIKIEDGNIL